MGAPSDWGPQAANPTPEPSTPHQKPDDLMGIVIITRNQRLLLQGWLHAALADFAFSFDLGMGILF